jgi:hypothetical protein
MAIFSVHFDGPITTDHRLPLRVMAKTYEHMQRAIDRAYLLDQYGEVWKNARLTDDQYAETEFLADWPREGGIVLDAIRAGAEEIIDRVQGALRPVFERATQEGLRQAETMQAQIGERREYVEGMGARTMTFTQLLDKPPADWQNAYSERSIVKEIDQLVGQITPDRHDGSVVEIGLCGRRWYPTYVFTRDTAKDFHIAASFRELAAPVVVEAKIRSLDQGNKYVKPKAKILVIATGREVTLHLSGDHDFYLLHPHHTAESVQLYVSPVLEAGGYDLHGGDLQFLAVA